MAATSNDGEPVEEHDERYTSGIAMGRCFIEHQSRPLWEIPPTIQPSDLPKVRYSGFRKKRSIWVGQSSLAIASMLANEERLFAVSEMENQLRLYETKSGRLLAANPIADFPRFGRGDLAMWPNASEPWQVLFANENGVFLLDATTAQRTAQLSTLGAWELDWSHDESLLGASLHAIPEQVSKIAFYSVDRERLSPTLRAELVLGCSERADAWAFNHKKDALLIQHFPSNDLTLYDLRSHAVRWTIPGPEYANSVDWSLDDGQIAVAGAEVWLLDPTNSRELARYTKLGNNVHRVRFSPNGEVLAVSAYDGHARLLSTTPQKDGKLTVVKDLRHNGTANVYAVDFSRDGKTLLTSSGDQTLAIWGE